MAGFEELHCPPGRWPSLRSSRNMRVVGRPAAACRACNRRRQARAVAGPAHVVAARKCLPDRAAVLGPERPRLTREPWAALQLALSKYSAASRGPSRRWRQACRRKQRRRLRSVSGAQRVADLGLAGELLLDSFQRRHLLRGESVVVAQQRNRIVRRRADHRDLVHRRASAADAPVDSSAARSPCAPLPAPVLRCSAESFSEYGILENGTRSGGSNMPSLKRAMNRRSSDRSISASVIRPLFTASTSERYSLPQVRSVPAFTATAEASAAVGLVLVAAKDIGDGAAIAHDVALEAPIAAQALLQQIGVGAGRHAVHGVVGAHDGIGLALHDGWRGTPAGYVSFRSRALGFTSNSWRDGSGPLCTA